MHKLIREADPDVVEEWKCAKATSPRTPVRSQDGGICTGEIYKSVVKLTFFKICLLHNVLHAGKPGPPSARSGR